ncbi:PREDICTED: aspartic proteinase CDR1-like [Nicotiana attenuata]|uniref:aspartic proteinase CDR1-like n=1 Tax=Nicotiana attenuata TaxID=49451 RepID=UPI0009056732|nr:PREDICTED: aspartic proteinase CDR1-like [Nicotiana attenuata]
MIHYEAVNSPFYNPELTLEDRVRIMNERSETRISHLITDLEKDGNKFQIYPAYTSQFLVPLKIESPAPLYRYAESSSYVEDVYCGTSVCDLMILKGKCGVSTRRCEYTYSYATGRTRGHLASEVVAFELSNGTEVIFKRLIFGCSSIFSQGADKVSGVLGLGQRAGKYYITLEKISVGDKFLDIDPIIFKRIDHQGGMIVDSGATSSYLPEIAYKKLKEEIKSVIGTTLEEFISNRPNELCYYGIVTRDLKGLPT